jgi:molecular chaperone DnaK
MSYLENYQELPAEVIKPDRTLPKSDLIMGIDLGTTYSCVAVVQDDYPKVIPSAKGLRTTSSIIAVDDKNRLLIGEDARKQLLINPTNTIYGAKRFIGRHFYSEEVASLSKYFSYKVVPIGDMSVGAEIGGRKFSLPQVSAMILNELRVNACTYLKQNVTQAVVSVPAYYTENQREAVREAGRIAGLDIVRIINEPTAAALAYGLNRKMDKKILVYDLGGGTFDASVLQLYEDVFKVLATGGDTFLGGVDFDERIVDFILSEYERIEEEILQCDSVITQRMKDAAERAKIELSNKTFSQIDLPYITISKGKFKDFRCDMNRQQLDELTKDLIDRTIEVCIEVLDSADLQPEDVDSVILVGGQTRMPLVMDRVSVFFGKAPTKGVHPDEVVACGAALMGHSLGTTDSVRLMDVLPMSIGARQPDGKMKVVFPTNCSLPADRNLGVATVFDNQEAIEVFLYQGESEKAIDNEFLGAFVITGFPKAAKGVIKLVINVSLNQESILDVSARTFHDKKNMHVQMVRRAPIKSDEIKLEPLEPLKEKPEFNERTKTFFGLRGFIKKIKGIQ